MRSEVRIPFNVPYLTGQEGENIQQLLASGSISSNGKFTKLCEAYFRDKYKFDQVFLTSSGTAALEMAAILLGLKEGDEIILPSYTFTSTANAFALRGAKLVFADSSANHPNLNAAALHALITPRTKAIVVVHYGGMACDMEIVKTLCDKHGLFLIEDAAQAIDAYYLGQPLGSFGDMATFSFHETKNIVAGECGLLVINNPQFVKLAEIVREKGTNRSAFFRGETDKYTWCALGSSYLPSEVASAMLWAQLQHLPQIQATRVALWEEYYRLLLPLSEAKEIALPPRDERGQHNASVFYFVVKEAFVREKLLQYLRNEGIGAVFHYQSLHNSPFFLDKHDGRPLPEAERYTHCLVRLPLYPSLQKEEVALVAKHVMLGLNNN